MTALADAPQGVDSARERCAFLQDVLNLQLVQTSPHTKTHSGDASSKNLDGDGWLNLLLLVAVGGESEK